jgi:hypothetical protein
VGSPSFGSFFGEARKERPRGGYRTKTNVPQALKKLCSFLEQATFAQQKLHHLFQNVYRFRPD